MALTKTKQNQPPEIDFSEDIRPITHNPKTVLPVAKLAALLVAKQRDITFYEDKLKKIKEEAREIQEQHLPDAMTTLGIERMTLTTGEVIEIKPVCEGSITKEKLPEALDWLKQHGHGGIIKYQLTAALERGKESIALAAAKALKKLGVEVQQKETVHPQTLGAWAREMRAAGKAFPTDLLGIYVGRRATVSNPVATNSRGV